MPAPQPASRRHALIIALFSLTIFVNAALLFVVEPMWAKMVLPLLGGTPAVWNTCMLFFQGMLLAGYLYAHLTSRRFDVRRQVVVQLAVLLLAMLFLPIAVARGWTPPPGSTPVSWLLVMFTVSLGAPFFVLSAGAPILQRWFAASEHSSARNPYFLYAASNLGSLVALLSYPFVIEPRLRLVEQSRVWTVVFIGLTVLIAVCGVAVWRGSLAPVPDGVSTTVPNDAIPPAIGVPLTWHRRVRWVLLALVPSSLLLALTTYLTTDVAAVPLLWIVPLSIYLLTFVLTFARRPPLPHNLMLWGQPLFVLSLVITMGLGMQRGEGVIAVIHLLAFFFTAMVCHGELARNRPDVTHLTEFYLWISVGGVLGGVFNVVIAPQIFNRVLEYPIAVVLACALRPSLGKRPPRKISPALDVVLPLALGSALLYWIETPVLHAKWLGEHGSVIVFGVYALICLVFIRRPIRFALSVAALLLAAGAGYAEDNIIYRARSFFGVYRVIRYPEHHMLQNGTTTHGAQSTLPDRRQEPLTYYHRDGPLGQIFATLFPGDTNRRVAIVGLGAGTIACYGRPNESWTYYEIDPLIMRIASDTTLFTYLRDCPPHKRIVLGDARLSLAAAPDSSYDLILLDAFSSDAIPVHLMTREALAMYMRKLAPGGSIAFHISNRYLHLEPVVSELARDARLPGAVGEDESLTDEQKDDQKSLSHWVLLSRRAADHAAIERLPGWAPLAPRGNTRLWTDDFSDILSVIHFR